MESKPAYIQSPCVESREFKAHVQSPNSEPAPACRTPVHHGSPARTAVFQSAAWKLTEARTLSMTHADEGGCRAPGPHAISTRTAHTTTTSSIHRVPKTAATGARQYPPLRDRHRTGRLPVYQSTSRKVLQKQTTVHHRAAKKHTRGLKVVASARRASRARRAPACAPSSSAAASRGGARPRARAAAPRPRRA